MKYIPDYPETAPLELAMRDEVAPCTDRLKDGACEFSFASMFLHRHKYRYRISRLNADSLMLAGTEPEHAMSGRSGASFFSVAGAPPPVALAEALVERYGMWKTVTVSLYAAVSAALAEKGYVIAESRDDFDYLYERSDLAELRGKTFHKKKNMVNAFLASFTPDVRPLTSANAGDAQHVLETWTRARQDEADYAECTEALSLMDELRLDGTLVCVGGAPAAFSLGEPVAGGAVYCVHFEKGVNSYKGIFQYVNQAAAQRLPESVHMINREQDTGDEGLRQSKMTYRPCDFVVKYLVLPPGSAKPNALPVQSTGNVCIP
jgi:hypothetical protein